MSDQLESLHLKLPYLAAAQAQKHVTHNEALRRLDSIVQLAVLDAALTAPPAAPHEGDRYIVAAGGTGAWAGHDGAVASFVDGAWDFATPETGWLAFDIAAGVLLVRQTSSWTAAAGGMVDHFGINATADDTNRLAVKSSAVLFSGIEAAQGGSGDIRFVVNKEADGDTASLLFQSGWSGRAEVGLTGDTDFVFKVSADGSNWIEAIRIDKGTGLPTLLYDNSASGLAATTLHDAIDEVAAGGGGGGGAVASVFGRTGAVAAAVDDYHASQIGNDSGVGGATVKNALETLASDVAGKQASDSDLTALAGVSAAGLLARTGAGTAAARTLTGANGVAVTNGDGISGNPAIAGVAATTAAYGVIKLGTEVRERLTANRTYYVRTDGNDANSGLANTSGGAFLTIQKAIDVAAALDIGVFTVTIQVGAGTYTAGALVTGPWNGSGTVELVGDATTPANVIISVASAYCITAQSGGRLSVKGFKLTTTTAGSGLRAQTNGLITVTGKMEYGACATSHILAIDGGVIYNIGGGDYTISGNAPIHLQAEGTGLIKIQLITITLTGTPAFSTAFAYADFAQIVCNANTFSGTGTGSRYAAKNSGFINTFGSGTSYLPGNAAGTGTNPSASPYGTYA